MAVWVKDKVPTAAAEHGADRSQAGRQAAPANITPRLQPENMTLLDTPKNLSVIERLEFGEIAIMRLPRHTLACRAEGY